MTAREAPVTQLRSNAFEERNAFGHMVLGLVSLAARLEAMESSQRPRRVKI